MKRTMFRLGVLILMTGFAGAVFGQTTVLDDDFSGGLGANWSVGTNSALNPGGPTAAVIGGRLEWMQGYDYIESKQTFTGDLNVLVDVERTPGSGECQDFVVELTTARGASGVLLLQNNQPERDSITLGQAPAFDTLAPGWEGSCITAADPNLSEILSVPPQRGLLTLSYAGGFIRLTYENDQGLEIRTERVRVGILGPTAIRIWASGANHFVHRVIVQSIETEPPDFTNCAAAELRSADLVLDVPCVLVDGIPFEVVLVYDPTKTDGVYFKVDLLSLRPVTTDDDLLPLRNEP